MELKSTTIFGADLKRVDIFSGAAIDHADGRVIWPHDPSVAPLNEGNDYRDKIPAFLGESVVGAFALGRYWDTVEDVVCDETIKAFAENIPGDAKLALEIGETAGAKICLANDQEGPPFADHVE